MRKIFDDYRINRLLAFLWFFILNFSMLSPSLKQPSLFYWQDKAEHIIAFSVLSLFICRSFHPVEEKKLRIVSSFCISGSYGIISELIQGIIPGRQMSFLDFFADILGVLLGIIIFLHIFNNARN